MEGHLVVRREVNELHNVDLAPSGPVRSLCPEAGPYLRERIQLKALQRTRSTHRASEWNMHCIEYEDASYREEVVRVDFDLSICSLSMRDLLRTLTSNWLLTEFRFSLNGTKVVLSTLMIARPASLTNVSLLESASASPRKLTSPASRRPLAMSDRFVHHDHAHTQTYRLWCCRTRRRSPIPGRNSNPSTTERCCRRQESARQTRRGHRKSQGGA